MESKLTSGIFLAPAKINLFLKVLAKRPDGYHEIYSIIQPVSLYDEIAIDISEGRGIYVACDDPYLPTGEGNLAYRAASVFFERTGLRRVVRIGITKRIPVAAGLGGGSSNAATVLAGLNMLLDAGLKEHEVIEMASAIGSDVPFFVLGSPAIVRGRGEVLERVRLPRCWYILVNPGFGVTAAWAYGNLNLTNSGADTKLSNSVNVPKDCQAMVEILSNDLEYPVVESHPELARIKVFLEEAGAEGVLLSGSGPTIFGLFSKKDAAVDAHKGLLGIVKPSRHSVFLVQGLG